MDILKENVIEDLENESLSYITVGKFLTDLKKRIWEREQWNNKSSKAKKDRTRRKMMEEFV